MAVKWEILACQLPLPELEPYAEDVSAVSTESPAAAAVAAAANSNSRSLSVVVETELVLVAVSLAAHRTSTDTEPAAAAMATEVAPGGKDAAEFAEAATEPPSPTEIVAAIPIQTATETRAACRTAGAAAAGPGALDAPSTPHSPPPTIYRLP